LAREWIEIVPGAHASLLIDNIGWWHEDCPGLQEFLLVLRWHREVIVCAFLLWT